MIKVEQYEGTYSCMICYESCRASHSKILKCSACSANLMHEECIGVGVKACPQCSKDTLRVWRKNTAPPPLDAIVETIPGSSIVRVGHRLEVLWDTPQGYFPGDVIEEKLTLVNDKQTTIEHRVKYEDGSAYWHDFDLQSYKILQAPAVAQHVSIHKTVKSESMNETITDAKPKVAQRRSKRQRPERNMEAVRRATQAGVTKVAQSKAQYGKLFAVKKVGDLISQFVKMIPTFIAEETPMSVAYSAAYTGEDYIPGSFSSPYGGYERSVWLTADMAIPGFEAQHALWMPSARDGIWPREETDGYTLDFEYGDEQGSEIVKDILMNGWPTHPKLTKCEKILVAAERFGRGERETDSKALVLFKLRSTKSDEFGLYYHSFNDPYGSGSSCFRQKYSPADLRKVHSNMVKWWSKERIVENSFTKVVQCMFIEDLAGEIAVDANAIDGSDIKIKMADDSDGD